MYSGMKGMMSWDVMDVGLYNDNGRTPSGYTAMDKYTAGWLEPTVIDGPATGLRLNPLSESNELTSSFAALTTVSFSPSKTASSQVGTVAWAAMGS